MGARIAARDHGCASAILPLPSRPVTRLAPAVLALLLVLAETAAAENPFVRITTTLGSFVVELCAEVSAQCPGDAPDTVANFLRYVDEDAYPATTFVHRRTTIVMTGLYYVDETEVFPWILVPTFPPIPLELDPLLPNLRGTLGMWRPLGPDSAMSEWYVNATDNPSLDGPDGMAVFGRVVAHLGVVDAIAALPVEDFGLPNIHEVPLTRVRDPSEPINPLLVSVPSIVRVPEAGAASVGAVALLTIATLRRRRARTLLAAGVGALLLPAGALAANPVVRVATVLGDFEIELCAETSAVCLGAAPNTVANFLRYVDENKYPDTSFIHRHGQQPPLLEGGTFWIGEDEQGPFFELVPEPFPAVPLELVPGLSNVRGSIAMQHPPGQPDGGHGDWFLNLADNPVLDTADGGFAVFGHVTGGMDVVDEIAAVPVYMFLVGQLPLIDYPGGDASAVPHLVYVSGIERVPEASSALLGAVSLTAVALRRRRRPAPGRWRRLARRAALVAIIVPATAHAENPFVRFATPLGNIDIELCQEASTRCATAAPLTVANFLGYVDAGAYHDSFVHRRALDFVIQGGSFVSNHINQYFQIDTGEPVLSEFIPGPPPRNVRGTMSVPLPADPPGSTNPCDTGENQGTSGWFINLGDNSGLDCGLFTVFGVVASGMEVADEINLRFAVNFGVGPSPVTSDYQCNPNQNQQCTTPPYPYLIYTEITRVPEPHATLLALVAGVSLIGLARHRRWRETPFGGL